MKPERAWRAGAAHNLRHRGPDDLLMMMDKTSMAASVDVRAPLLDNPLIDWALRLAPRHRIRKLDGRVLLERLARNLLPVVSVV